MCLKCHSFVYFFFALIFLSITNIYCGLLSLFDVHYQLYWLVHIIPLVKHIVSLLIKIFANFRRKNPPSPSSGVAYSHRQPTPSLAEIFCVCPYPKKINLPSFVNISPTLVIDASMERSSRVTQHEDSKIWIYFLEKKRSKLNFDFVIAT